MININLLYAPSNTELKVLEINAGITAKKRLISMGIHPGDSITKYNTGTWCPILVKNITLCSSKIAIGKRLASKILVEYDS